jgi:HB1, ASXL, restriction endonuclease HTH domain
MSNQGVLEEERNHLEERIKSLEALVEEAAAVLPVLKQALATMNATTTVAASAVVREQSKTYRGVPTVEAAVDVLQKHGGSAKTREIYEALAAGGWKTKAKNPISTLFGILHQDEERPSRRLFRSSPGTWSLA